MPGARLGFTLIELVVVMAIMALVVAVAAPALRLPADEPPSPSDSVRQLVRGARTEALRTGRSMRVVVDSRSDRYWVYDAADEEHAAGRFAFGREAGWSRAGRRVVLRVSALGGIEGDLPHLVHDDGRIERIAFEPWTGVSADAR